MSAQKTVLVSDPTNTGSTSKWQVSEWLDGTITFLSPSGDTIVPILKCHDGPPFRSSKNTTVVRVLLSALKSSTYEDRGFVQNLLEKIVGVSEVEKVDVWLAEGDQDLDGQHPLERSPSPTIKALPTGENILTQEQASFEKSASVFRSINSPGVEDVFNAMRQVRFPERLPEDDDDQSSESSSLSDPSEPSEIASPEHTFDKDLLASSPLNHDAETVLTVAQPSKIRITYASPRLSSIRVIEFLEAGEIDQSKFRVVYPATLRNKTRRILATVSILRGQTVTVHGSKLRPDASKQICQLLLEGISKELAVTKSYMIWKGNIESGRQARIDLRQFYDELRSSNFRPFAGSSPSGNPPSQSTPNNVKRPFEGEASQTDTPIKRKRGRRRRGTPGSVHVSQAADTNATVASGSPQSVIEVAVGPSFSYPGHSSPSTVPNDQSLVLSSISPTSPKDKSATTSLLGHTGDSLEREGPAGLSKTIGICSRVFG